MSRRAPASAMAFQGFKIAVDPRVPDQREPNGLSFVQSSITRSLRMLKQSSSEENSFTCGNAFKACRIS